MTSQKLLWRSRSSFQLANIKKKTESTNDIAKKMKKMIIRGSCSDHTFGIQGGKIQFERHKEWLVLDKQVESMTTKRP